MHTVIVKNKNNNDSFIVKFTVFVYDINTLKIKPFDNAYTDIPTGNQHATTYR